MIPSWPVGVILLTMLAEHQADVGHRPGIIAGHCDRVSRLCDDCMSKVPLRLRMNVA